MAAPGVAARVVFEDARLQVVHAPGASAYAVATFAPRGYAADGQRFWGDVLARSHGVECFGYTAKAPDWYPAPSVHAAAAAIAPLRRGPLIGYGHSMGGYACLRHAAVLRLAGSIANAPKISLNPADLPRGGKPHRDFDPALHQDMRVRAADIVGRVVVAFDPQHEDDRWHAEEIARLSPSVEFLRIPYAGHRTVLALKPAGVLLPLFDAILGGQDLRPVARAARDFKKIVPLYRQQLGRALVMRRKPRAAIRLLEGMVPADAELALRRALTLARAYHQAGRPDLALPLMREAAAGWPDNRALRAELDRMESRPPR